jgi:hypothetical protein
VESTRGFIDAATPTSAMSQSLEGPRDTSTFPEAPRDTSTFPEGPRDVSNVTLGTFSLPHISVTAHEQTSNIVTHDAMSDDANDARNDARMDAANDARIGAANDARIGAANGYLDVVVQTRRYSAR